MCGRTQRAGRIRGQLRVDDPLHSQATCERSGRLWPVVCPATRAKRRAVRPVRDAIKAASVGPTSDTGRHIDVPMVPLALAIEVAFRMDTPLPRDQGRFVGLPTDKRQHGVRLELFGIY